MNMIYLPQSKQYWFSSLVNNSLKSGWLYVFIYFIYKINIKVKKLKIDIIINSKKINLYYITFIIIILLILNITQYFYLKHTY